MPGIVCETLAVTQPEANNSTAGIARLTAQIVGLRVGLRCDARRCICSLSVLESFVATVARRWAVGAALPRSGERGYGFLWGLLIGAKDGHQASWWSGP